MIRDGINKSQSEMEMIRDEINRSREDMKGMEDRLKNDCKFNIERLEKKCEDRAINLENLIKNNKENLEMKNEELNKRIEDVYRENKASDKKLDKKVDRSIAMSKENRQLINNAEERIREQLMEKYNQIQETLLEKSVNNEVHNDVRLSDLESNIKSNNELIDKRITGIVTNYKKYQEDINLRLEDKGKESQQILKVYEGRTDQVEDQLKILKQVVEENSVKMQNGFSQVKKDIQKGIFDQIKDLNSIDVNETHHVNSKITDDLDVRKLYISNTDDDHNKDLPIRILGLEDRDVTQVKSSFNNKGREYNVSDVINNDEHQRGKISNPLITNLIKIKAFSGKSRESPLEYLHTLEELFLLCKFNEQEKLAIACNNLFAYAKEWWRSLFEKPITFGDFRHLILSCYWSEDRQDQVRYRVSQEKYSAAKGSYIQFFRSQAVKLKGLTAFPLSEVHILRILRHNLPKTVEQILIAANCHSIEHAAEILDALEVSELDSESKSKVQRDRYEYKVNSVSVVPVHPRTYNDYQSNNRRHKNVYYKNFNDNHNIRNSNVKSFNYKKQNRGKSQEIKNADQPSTSGVTTILKRSNNAGKTQQKTKMLN